MSRKKKETGELDPLTIAEAATNSPLLSEDEVVLGDKKFKLMNLRYDDYIAFMAYLKPVFGPLFSSFGIDTGEREMIDYAKIVALCQSNLPEMALLVLKQSTPSITLVEVKELCGTPFKMAELVLLQINKNNLIADFSNFFGLMTKMLKV